MLIQSLPCESYSVSAVQLVHASTTTQDARARARKARSEGGCHTLKIAFDQIAILISVTGHPTRDISGAASPLLVTRVSRPSRSAGCHVGDAMHVEVVSALLYEYLDKIQDQGGPGDVPIVDPRFAQDPAIEQLARALVATDEVEQGLGALYADAVCVAIVTRLLGMRCAPNSPTANRRRTALQKWRLKRVVDYVGAHLAKSITLAELANAAGLTRMHFAAQFRVATGARPHEYVLRRRIERAQELLRISSLTLVDVALSVGFQTQSHFTTVFKRFTGETPHRWRRSTAGANPGHSPNVVPTSSNRESTVRPSSVGVYLD
jgi:AraC-like DNA-binding protein